MKPVKLFQWVPLLKFKMELKKVYKILKVARIFKVQSDSELDVVKNQCQIVSIL